MKKMIKMSLVAAVAVAGLSTTSSAASLEDAIQGVELNGYLRYRYTNGELNDNDTNHFRIQATTKAKVNDYITAKVSIQGQVNSTDTAGDQDKASDGTFDLRELNFIGNFGDATVIVGKQGLVTPFADSSLDSQQGTGIVGMMPVGPVTLAGGYYINSDAETSITGSEVALTGSNIAALGVLGTADVLNYSLWYANLSNSNDIDVDADAINLNLSATLGPVNVEFNYALIDYDVEGADGTNYNNDTEQTRLFVSGDIGIVTLTGGVIVAGDEGGDTTLGDTDASSNFVMEEFTGSALTDTTAYYLGVSVPVGPVTIGLEHGTTSDVDGTASGDTDFSETKLSIAYPMSKNFKVSGWITETSGDTLNGEDFGEKGATRLELKYTF